MWSIVTVCRRGGSGCARGSGDFVRPGIVPNGWENDKIWQWGPYVNCFTSMGVDLLSPWSFEDGNVVVCYGASEAEMSIFLRIDDPKEQNRHRE